MIKNSIDTFEGDVMNCVYENFRNGYSLLNSQNWVNTINLFLKIIPNNVSSDFSKRIICGWLAALCEKSYYLTAHLKSETEQIIFEEELMKIIIHNNLPGYLFKDGPVLCGKKQPSFVESVSPTLERYRVMEFLKKRFNRGIKSIIIGGSMSYGAFYSVRGNIDNGEVSDIDGLVVIDDSFFEFEQENIILNSNEEILLAEEVDLFKKRLVIFKQLLSEDKADIISQRFSLKGKNFNVSLHFLPVSLFTDITTGAIIESIDKKKDKEYIIRDFRTDYFTHPCIATNSFIATRHESLVTGYPVNGGYISNMPGYLISKGILFPGVYHTVIYPAFLVFYDKDGFITECIKKFEMFLYCEVEKQRANYPFASYNKGHNRYDIFAPGRYEEGNNSFLHPKHLDKYKVPTNTQILIKKSFVENDHNQDLSYEMPNTISIRNRLISWKEKTLELVETEIKKFRLDPHSFYLLKSLKKDGKPWYTVYIIPSMKKEYMYFKKPFLKEDSNEIIIGIIEQENILPKDLLKLKEYNELVKVFGRVFVSASYDSADQEKRYPIYLSLIIRT